MSDTENSRPGLISAGILHPERTGESFPTCHSNSVDEPPNESPQKGVVVYRTIPAPEDRNTDGSLRRLLAVSIMAILGVTAFAGIGAHVWIAVQTSNTGPLDSFVDNLLTTLVPVITLLVGYVCGKALSHNSAMRRRNVTLKDTEQTSEMRNE